MPNDPCKNEREAVNAIEAGIEELQAELSTAPTPHKAAIVARIKAEEIRLAKAQAQLDACELAHAPPTIPDLAVVWPATIRGWLRGAFTGRATAQIDLSLKFIKSRTEFRLDPFSVTVTVKGVAIVLNVTPTDTGSVLTRDPPDPFRDMVIPAQVSGTAFGVGIPNADISFDTSAHFKVPAEGAGDPIRVDGSAMNGNGYLAMVGFADVGAAGLGARVYLQIDGKLPPPLPWGV